LVFSLLSIVVLAGALLGAGAGILELCRGGFEWKFLGLALVSAVLVLGLIVRLTRQLLSLAARYSPDALPRTLMPPDEPDRGARGHSG
jgi:hypothetical protein